MPIQGWDWNTSLLVECIHFLEISHIVLSVPVLNSFHFQVEPVPFALVAVPVTQCVPVTVRQDLACHTTADAGSTVSEVSQGLLQCLGGGITRGDAGTALAFCLCVTVCI